jgi:uncharacterized protein YrrD
VSHLLLDEDLKGRVVVSVDGDDVAVVDGLVRDGDDVTALTLAKTGLFGGSMDEVLPVGAIVGIGPDAVLITTGDAFVVREELAEVATTADILSEEAPDVGDDAQDDVSVLFTEARQREVVSDDDGEAVGRIDRFVVDPGEQRVGSFRLDNVADMKRYLSYRNIDDFGEDRVTVPTAGVLRLPDGPREERIRRDFGMLGKRILTDTGHELGKVVDVAFDPGDGAVTAVVLEDGEVAGDRLRGVGPYAVVVAH